MPQFNNLSLADTYGRGLQEKQSEEFNALRMNAAEQQLGEQERVGNTRWMLQVSEMARSVPPEQLPQFVSEVEAEGARRGVWQALPQGVAQSGPENIMSGFQTMGERARIGLAGVVEPTKDKTSAQRNIMERRRLVEQHGENSPQVRTFDSYVRAPRIVEVGGVPTQVGPQGNTPLSSQEQETAWIEQEAAAQERGSRSARPTQAQDTVDTEFAKEYVALTAGGGLTDAQKAVSQLDQVYNTLTSGQNVSGLAIALQPRSVLAVTNPQALDTRDQVEEVVQRNLRLILGAQFTEREGVRLIERAYNPALDESYNAVRVGRLFDQIRTAAKFKMAMVRHYEQNGTLQGFEVSSMPDMQTFWDALSYRRGDVVNGYEFLGGDAANRDNWRQVTE